ncbi:MAG: tRNA lysidine(34) synthetase TilS [Devosia sp. 67-54]|uniref:tRNA lysidine(34) synthetase TilS n=1 Tax=unclassified Devosia TaxID=196773 RepID=UPI0009610092|nr:MULTISPECIES: tRNA lysidine(34) synthetase TilS [unclassified Devosia]MBN9306122.1 tRNA lysidine(34) synthetase TilS [Devosia sp.]OJX16213.1 MAG: tRNA lysidine(34) synthetase TilS [Devosia sp. 67-54]
MPGVSEAEIELLLAPVARAGKLALAVSGGPDSLALLLLAAQWARSPGRPALVVYSVDHGLRPEAAEEVAMVRREAAALGLESRALRWDGDKPETGVQAAARKARYGLMAAAMQHDHAEYLLTAHHLGDQAETVLMRLAHGSGIEGLRGMDRFATIEGCQVFRPLLAVEPALLADIVAAAGLTPAHDPSNGNRHYERVRWRQLMPVLEELGLDLRRVGDFAARMADADALLAGEAGRAFAVLVHLGPDGDAQLPHAGVAALNRAVAVRLLGRVLRTVGGERKPHALGALETLHGKLMGRVPLKPTTLHGCVVASDGVTISVVPEAARRTPALMTAG